MNIALKRVRKEEECELRSKEVIAQETSSHDQSNPLFSPELMQALSDQTLETLFDRLDRLEKRLRKCEDQLTMQRRKPTGLR